MSKPIADALGTTERRTILASGAVLGLAQLAARLAARLGAKFSAPNYAKRLSELHRSATAPPGIQVRTPVAGSTTAYRPAPGSRPVGVSGKSGPTPA